MAIAFKTKKQLIDWLEETNKFDTTEAGNFYPVGFYELRYGEYEKPELKPTRYKDGWSLKVIYFYYQGGMLAPTDGRVSDGFYDSIEGGYY